MTLRATPSGIVLDDRAFTVALTDALRVIDPPPRDMSPLERLGWRAWVPALLDDYVGSEFAPHHAQLWDWVWALEADTQPEHDALVAVLSRGGGKSTTAEAAVVAVGARHTRHYALYLCETQDQADDHVASIQGMLESVAVASEYPHLSSRLLTKFGHSKGWKRNRLRTASGFTVDAIGLDSAARGAKLDAERPDLFVLDDLDSETDTLPTTEKKIRQLTRKLLPAGTNDLAVLAIQNLVHERSIFARLANVADGVPNADFLARRVVVGPIPAMRDLVVEHDPARADPERDLSAYRIVSGEPTWAGQGVDECQQFIDRWGLSAFLKEAQHETEPPAGGMFDHLEFVHCTWDAVPALIRTAIWVDPAVTDTDQSDSMGIQADGLAVDGKVYRLWSWEQRTSPLDALVRAITKAVELGADTVGVETDQGGDTWQSVYREAAAEVLRSHPGARVPPFRWEKAGAGHGPKTHRASLMLADYERARIVHVAGTHEVLERALRRFPRSKPFDLVDAAFWSWRDLRKSGPARSHGRQLLAAGGLPRVAETLRR